MKVITEKTTNIVSYVLDESRTVTIGSSSTLVGSTSSPKYGIKEEFIIGDISSATHTLHTVATEPADWKGTKYKFDGTTWTLNADFEIVCDKCLAKETVTVNDYDATKCSECGESL